MTGSRKAAQHHAPRIAALLARIAMACLVLSGVALASVPALGQGFPARPVRFVIAFAPGGSTDVVARLAGAKLGERWPQPVIVENRGGGGTVIATDLVAKSDPDGHTVLFTSAAFAINPSLRRSLPYDSRRDLAPVTMAVTAANLLVVHPAVPATTVAELIAHARARPGQVSYGSSGVGAGNHLSGELLALRAGIELLHVPFRGTGEAVNSLLSGQISMMFDSMISGLTQAREGRVRAIAVTTAARSPAAPDVPAIGESLPGYEVNSWLGTFVAGRTPPAIVQQLNRDLVWALNQPDVTSRLAELGTTVVADAPEAFRLRLEAEMATWAEVIRAARITPE
jgi:tripartite-type tricarboxylate transporter receptor subunit TctC